MDRFEAVSSVRQGSLHDDTHGVIEIGLAHLAFDAGQSDVAYFHECIPLTWHVPNMPQTNISLAQSDGFGEENPRTDATSGKLAAGSWQRTEPPASAGGSLHLARSYWVVPAVTA